MLEFIEYLAIIITIGLFSVITIGILRRNPLKSKAKKTIEDIAGESFGTLGGINETLRKEIKSLQGQKQRLTQKINELSGMEEDSEYEDEAKLDTPAITQAVKSIMPNATEFQIAAALNIPQVKELLGNGKNLKLITELLPLLKAGSNTPGSNEQAQGTPGSIPFA